MARSGSYDFSINRDEIINGAFRLLGVLGESQTASSTRISQASQALNLMIDMWESMGIGLWLNKELVLFVQKDQVKYYIGPNMQSTYGDYACLFTDYAKTEISAAEAAAQTTLSIDSSSPSNPADFTNGDYIGVETDNLDIHWSTINGVPNATDVTITTGLDYAAAVDRHVYAFTTIPQRPLEIISAFRRDGDENDVMMEIISLDQYRQLSVKTSEGQPNVLAQDRQLDDVVVFLWPEPDDMKTRIHIFVRYPLQDFDATADDWDFPRGWGEAIKYNLALRLAAEYGRKLNPDVEKIAMLSLEAMMGGDFEHTGFKVKPSRAYR